MATFGTAADFNRPTPEAGGRVSSNGGVPNILPAAEVGPARAQALYQQGQELKDVSQIADKFGQELDAAAAQDALNQLRLKRQELTYDPEKGYLRIKGGDVLKEAPSGKRWLEELPGQFQSASDEIGGKLFSPRARAMFREAAAQEGVGYKREVLAHVIDQSERYKVAVYKDGVQGTLMEAVAVGNDTAKLEAIADRAASLADGEARRTGLPSQAKAARSNVFRSAIEGQIARNNPGGALAMFGLYKGELDGKDALEVEGKLKTVEANATARNFVSGPSAMSEAQGRDMVIKARIAAGDDHETAVAWAANLNHESTFRPGAVNPRDGRDGSDSIGLGQWNGPRARALQKFALERGMNPGDASTQLQYLQAEVDGTIPYSISGVDPSFKDRLKAAKTAEEKARLISVQFFKPAGGEGEGRSRGATAARYRQETAAEYDPLRKAVDGATPQQGAAEGPRGFLDTKQALLDLNRWRDAKSAENQRLYGSNPTQLAANQQMIEQHFGLRQREIQTAQLTLDKAVDDWMTAGGPNGGPALDRPPPEVWNQLTYEKQRSIDATLAHNAKGQDAITDQQTWYEIQRGLSSADPVERQKWASEPLWKYKNKLSNSDFQELAKIQGEVRKGDPNRQLTHIRTTNQMVDDALLQMKIDPTPKPGSGDAERAARFRRAVQDRLTEFEAAKGSKASTEELQKIVDSLTRKVGGTDGFLGIGGYKRQYEMKIDDVPKAERAKIEDALRRNGRPVSDQTIIDLYSLKNAR